MKHKILVISPHPDDGELGSGGYIKKLTSSGHVVFYVAFSLVSESLPKGFAKKDLRNECLNSTAHLGIDRENVTFYDFKVRHFNFKRQEILEILISLRDRIKPQLVILPSSYDIHQDHKVIHEEGLRAFKNINVLGYQLIWNVLENSNNFFVELDENHVKYKSEALRMYKSQSSRKYMQDSFILSWARTNGMQINAEYAESLELIRWIQK